QTPVVEARVRSSILVSLAMIAAAVVAGVLLSIRITRGIVNPLLQAVRAADAVAMGETDIQIRAESADETRQLLDAMSRMVASTRQMTAAAGSSAEGDLGVEVKPRSERDALGHALARMVGKLTQVIGEVQSGASAVSSAASQMSSTSESLSQGTSEQAASVEE